MRNHFLLLCNIVVFKGQRSFLPVWRVEKAQSTRLHAGLFRVQPQKLCEDSQWVFGTIRVKKIFKNLHLIHVLCPIYTSYLCLWNMLSFCLIVVLIAIMQFYFPVFVLFITKWGFMFSITLHECGVNNSPTQKHDMLQMTYGLTRLIKFFSLCQPKTRSTALKKTKKKQTWHRQLNKRVCSSPWRSENPVFLLALVHVNFKGYPEYSF